MEAHHTFRDSSSRVRAAPRGVAYRCLGRRGRGRPRGTAPSAEKVRVLSDTLSNRGLAAGGGVDQGRHAGARTRFRPLGARRGRRLSPPFCACSPERRRGESGRKKKETGTRREAEKTERGCEKEGEVERIGMRVSLEEGRR